MFSIFPPWENTAVTETLPMGRVSHLSSRVELYMSTSVTWKAREAITFTMRLSFSRTLDSRRERKGRKPFMEHSLQGFCMGYLSALGLGSPRLGFGVPKGLTSVAESAICAAERAQASMSWRDVLSE